MHSWTHNRLLLRHGVTVTPGTQGPVSPPGRKGKNLGEKSQWVAELSSVGLGWETAFLYPVCLEKEKPTVPLRYDFHIVKCIHFVCNPEILSKFSKLCKHHPESFPSSLPEQSFRSDTQLLGLPPLPPSPSSLSTFLLWTLPL